MDSNAQQKTRKKKKVKNKSLAQNYLTLLEEYSNPGQIREILENERKKSEIIETLPYLEDFNLPK